MTAATICSGTIVRLEPLSPDQVAAAARCCADRTARQMLKGRVPGMTGTTSQREAGIFGHLFREPVTPFGVWTAGPDPEMIGVRYLERLETTGDVCTCGGWINRSSRRQGYGSAALNLAVRHAFESFGVSRIVTGTSPRNIAARAMLTSCGFVHVDTWRHRRAVTQIWQLQQTEVRRPRHGADRVPIG